jgi:23S rRNA (uracil1939-C5)-methyltransferase
LLLTIEKLIYGGDGLARLPFDSRTGESHTRGKAVFLPFVLEGEKIEATLTGQKPGFARAVVDTVIQTSPHRIAPACSYFGRCGGCHYQHATYEHQLEIKKEILRETLRRTAKLELSTDIQVHPSPPWNYRNRSRLQVQTHPSFAAGYFKHASHELQPVEECPISSPLINRALADLWQFGRAGKVPEGVTEVELFANADDTQVLIELSCSADSRRAAVRAFAEDLSASTPQIAGIVAFRAGHEGRNPSTATNPIPEKLLAVGASHLTYSTETAAYRVSAGSFFQTNRHLTDELVKIVTAGRSGAIALDLYSGVGLFSTALSFKHVISVESSQTSSADLAYNLPPHGKAVQATAEQYLAHAKNAHAGNPGQVEKGATVPTPSQTPELVVVDPPRSGLGERVARLLAGLRAPRITYVSCDPATLARDLVHLLAAGYRVDELHLIDLFPQTYHLESVVHLVR